MKKFLLSLLTLSLAISLGFLSPNSFAEDEVGGTSIRLTPTSKILQIASNNSYEESFEVFNDGDSAIKIEVYAAPYSYVYSDTEDLYKLGFNNENNFTQISRWITFLDTSGGYVERPTFSITPGASIKISFKVTTPNNIPAGGQYAVIFAHTLSDASSASGIRTEASPGIVVYGRSNEGEVITSAEISELKIDRNKFTASAKIKNTGNVDFTAAGLLKVEPIIGFSSYETAEGAGRLSIIPEAELSLSDQWADAPSFGIYRATWTVTVGENSKTTSKIIFLLPVWFIILIISLLTILTIWIIIKVRKRKERRSRLAI